MRWLNIFLSHLGSATPLPWKCLCVCPPSIRNCLLWCVEENVTRETAQWALQPAVSAPPLPRASHTVWGLAAVEMWSTSQLPAGCSETRQLPVYFRSFSQPFTPAAVLSCMHHGGAGKKTTGRMNSTSQTPALTHSVMWLSYSFLTFRLSKGSTIFLYFQRTNIFTFTNNSVYVITFMPSSSVPSPFLPLMSNI